MGMDIYGRNPKNETGEYFRANIWSWRVIHDLCNKAIAEHRLPLKTDGWGFNQGHGLRSQKDCTRLATSLEAYVKAHAPPENRYELPSDLHVQKGTGRFMNHPGPHTESAYSAGIDHVRDFIAFLKHCGGFEIR